jgi:hypothetical protein
MGTAKLVLCKDEYDVKSCMTIRHALEKIGGLGIDEGRGYSDESRRLSETFARERGLYLFIVDIGDEYGESIPEISAHTNRGREKPCTVCGLTKRHVINCIALEGKYDVLVTGHNLDDEAAVPLGNILNWLTGYLARQEPVLEAKHGLVRKAKLSFYLSFLVAKEQGLFTNHQQDPDEMKVLADDGTQLHNCSTCGQPITVIGECAFCRMVAKGIG